MTSKFFKKLTPLSAVCTVGLILCVAEMINLFFSEKNSGGLATGVLGFITLLLLILIAIDRYLIERTNYKLLIILEIIFIILASFSYAFINRRILIYVETHKNYFVVLSDKYGKKKSDFQFRGIIDQNVTIRNDLIRINSAFLDNPSTEIVPPWGGSYNAYLDTIIHSERVKMQLYSNIAMDDKKDSIFNSVLKTIYR
jgi:hypothetical protein